MSFVFYIKTYSGKDTIKTAKPASSIISALLIILPTPSMRSLNVFSPKNLSSMKLLRNGYRAQEITVFIF